MRAVFILLFVLTGCVLKEGSGVAPERDCGEKGVVPDDGRCHCDDDCQSSTASCLSEYGYGVPGGSCTHSCKLDTDCSAGFVCEGKICSQKCTTSSECVAGRMCRAWGVDRPLSCFAVCDEDADCDNGACNVYSGDCLLWEEEIRGGGLNAPCTAHHDCRSGRCSAGTCSTMCDMSSPHCPEDGVCLRGWCENTCTAAGGCALNQSCVGTDAGNVCTP